MNTRILTVGILAALLAVGCQETGSETAKDVSKARADSAESVADAREKAAKQEDKSDKAVAEARSDQADVNQDAREEVNEVVNAANDDSALAQFEVAKAKAEGAHEIAVQKCGAYAGMEKDACVRLADGTLAESMKLAETTRDKSVVHDYND